LGNDTINLVILGASGDSVSLDNTGGVNWSAGVTGASLTGFTGTFNVYYTNNGTVVAIDDEITFSGFS
jgi:hypothetical protein